MVFRSLTLFARNRGPDEFWRKRKIFRIAQHFAGRRRNCYTNAIRAVHRALTNATIGRKLKKLQMKELWQWRLTAACEEHGITPYILLVGLGRCDILLNKKTLVDLAIWEPRTFKSLTNIACARTKADGLNIVSHLDFPAGVVTRGMLK
ncbi:39S ribosomal protein L20, mitochondrial [Venturia canescens]|uniref:39S ribosomal protein L20, mitochondrial n=1 Tax=Venturia canescens TaxID=32260 RepID=UPI001C9D37B4|nr:39S ribosomal protein L20, mitochondrial [Venturia canescens]